MPFSTTASCTEEEWTQLFDDVIKPAVEGATELGYECRRSTATRGNLVRGILEDLQSAHVVVADLTDRNANVFYELGVRHTLTDRTILIAQSKDDIPFDLQSYAYHVYDWRTEKGREGFSERLRELLKNVDQQPTRPDNPVSDFLGAGDRRAPDPHANADRLEYLERQVALISDQLARSDGGRREANLVDAAVADWIRTHSIFDEMPVNATLEDAARVLAASKNEVLLGTFMRSSERELLKRLDAKVKELRTTETGQVSREQIVSHAGRFVAAASPVVNPLERLALAWVDARFEAGIRRCMQTSGALITQSEVSGGGLRFASGLPAYLGWRLMLVMGAKAIDNDDYVTAGIIINEPIEVRLVGGQVSFEPLWLQRRLFYPEVYLGFADLGIKSLDAAWAGSDLLKAAFPAQRDYQSALAIFLALLALRHSDRVDTGNAQFYPGYRLISEHAQTFERMRARLLGQPKFRGKLATILGEDEAQFVARWPERARRLNRARLGDQYAWGVLEPDFPPSLEGTAS